MINGHAHAGRVPEAVECLMEVRKPGFVLDRGSLNTVIKAFTKKGDAADARHWSHDMLQTSLQPYTVTNNALINVCDTGALYMAEVSPREHCGLNGAMNRDFIGMVFLTAIVLGVPQSPPPSGPGDVLREFDGWC